VRPPFARVERSAGFTLIEALVALVVLSVGLLGVAGLQLSGLRYNMSAGSRTQASYLANDVLDRMRANLTSARKGDYDINFGGVKTGSSLAAGDVTAWLAEISAVLPAGQGRIVTDQTTNLATVSLQWVDSRGNDKTECSSSIQCTLTFTTVTQL
jgi:type IV pilus assembly protein PilV